MPKKVVEDGPAATEADAQKIILLWDAYPELLQRAADRKHLLQDKDGGGVVNISLDNASFNHPVLMGLVTNMLERHRLSADPVEILGVAVAMWYDRHISSYQKEDTFSVKVWAFRDAWVLHKLVTLFRPKVVRPERPRDSWI